MRGSSASWADPGRACCAGTGGSQPGGIDGDSGVTSEGARERVRRANPVARPKPRAMGPTTDSPRSYGTRSCGKTGRPAWSVRTAGGDRRLSRASEDSGGDGLGTYRGALRSVGAAYAIPGCGVESRGGGGDGVWACGGGGTRGEGKGGTSSEGVTLICPRARRTVMKARPGGASPHAKPTG